MGAAPRTPIFCWNLRYLPWNPHPNPNAPPNPNPCGTFETPWLFKSLHTLGSLAQTLILSARLPTAVPIGAAAVKMPAAATRSPEEQGEAEQRALAAALASGKQATVLEFYSPKCRLCNSLLDLVLELEKRNADCVNFVLADAENERWLPELLHYDVKYVPCFVLLDRQGRALAKTGVPTSRMHVIAGLSHLLKLKQPWAPGSRDRPI